MKITTKIVGVILTLAVLVGLVASMSVPAAASDLGWTNVKMPQVTEAKDATMFTIAADGKTMYLYDGTNIFKSTNGGTVWSKIKNVPPTGVEFSAIKVSQANSSVLIANAEVGGVSKAYKSLNGGASWTVVFDNDDIAGAIITSVDVSEKDGQPVYLAGTATGTVYLLQGGALMSTASGELAGGWDPITSVIDVAFSPTYDDDGLIVAIVNNDGDIEAAEAAVELSDVESNLTQWSDNVVIATSTDATIPIAMPSDFGSASNLFAAVGADIYRVSFIPGTDPLIVFPAASEVSSLAFNGANDDGTLAYALVAGGKVYTTTAAGTASVTLLTTQVKSSKKNPTGTNTVVAYGGDTIYAGTANGGFFSSADGVAFDGIAFMYVSSFEKTKLGNTTGLGKATMYQIVNDNDVNYMLFVTTDSGATWKMIYRTNESFSVKLSPANATDKTIYITTSPDGGTRLFNKSIDNGETWLPPQKAPNSYTAFAPIDGNSYYIGYSTAGIRKSTAGSAFVSLDDNIVTVMIPTPGFFVAYTKDGGIYVSTDDGATFARVGGPLDTFDTKLVAIDFANKTFYALDDVDLVKFAYGTDTAWSNAYLDLVSAVQTGDSEYTVTGIAVSGGFFYVTNSNNEIWRAASLLPGTFEKMPKTGTSVGGDLSGPISVSPNADGANVIYAKVAQNFYNDADPPVFTAGLPNNYPNKIVNYTDSIMKAPAIVAPAADASIPAVVDFSWKPVAGAQGYYAEVAYDSAFTNKAYTSTDDKNFEEGIIPGTIWTGVKLTAGKTYYWRVQVAAGKPIASAWSAPVKFVTQLNVNVDEGLNTASMSPAKGADNVPLNSAFTWGIVNGATAYDFQLSDKADFSTTIDSQTGLTTSAYSTTAALKNNTVYFWRVRAVNANGASAWVTSAFTTAPAPTVAPPPATQPAQTITIPTPTFNVTVPPASPASNATPAWAWVVIVIGAVLVIAVIILIVRTRRV